ncbi:NAD(P)-binding protein [Streptosporangium sp. DT93]|uniref:NAD(P)-binding protein n=1 Tax=Streptosporangium sp. DT93 TaxID=3393428 RepID=UPI003CF192EE
MTDPHEINPRKALELGMDRLISRRDIVDGVIVTDGIAASAPFRPGELDGPGERNGPGERKGLGKRDGPGGRDGLGRRDGPGGRDLGGRDGLTRAHWPVGVDSLRPPFPGVARPAGLARVLRDPRFRSPSSTPEPTGERYDLVVVGAGVSGVSAAYRWLERAPKARILILDDHDDVGGHALRHGLHPGGGEGSPAAYGGARCVERPPAWTPEARDLLGRLDIRSWRPGRHADHGPYPGTPMHDSVFCDRETFSSEKLVVFRAGGRAGRWIAELPVADRARRDLLTLYGDPPDWFPGLSAEEKQERLARLTYSGFLRTVCGVHPDVLKFVRTMPVERWGYGSDALGAIDAWGEADEYRYAGFAGLGLDGSKPSRYNSPTMIKEWRAGGSAARPFPGDDRVIVQMMLARMIPGFATATGAEGITTAAFDHAVLDRPGNRVRVRLRSPVVSAANDGPAGTAASATVGYVDGERVRTVRAGGVIMACWNALIPHLVGDLPPAQRVALHRAVKVPLVRARVRLRHWRAWRELGIGHTRFTGAYWCAAGLAAPSGPGGDRRGEGPAGPDEPITVHMTGAPVTPGMSPALGSISGRYALMATPYHRLEYGIRDQLARLLGPAGFDPALDIEAITVDRWGHGYAPEYATPWDLAFYPDGDPPAAVARRTHGRIAIANSDSVPAARTDAAVTAAYRAVAELQG